MLDALRQGLRHLVAARSLILLVWMAALLVALPGAVVVEEAIHASVGDRLVGEKLMKGFDTGWHGEFAAANGGLAATVSPSHVGIGATLDVLDAWWSGRLFTLSSSVVAFGAVFALGWLFLLGGIMGRLRRPWNRWRLSEVLATGSQFFPRFLRLGLIALPFYYGVFRFGGWIFPWIDRASRDVTEETTVLAWNLLAAGLVVLLLTVIRLVVDYARVAMVVEGHRKVLVAMRRGAAFVADRPVQTIGIVATFGLLTLGLLALWGVFAPGSGQGSAVTIVLALTASQIFMMGRLALRLGLISSELALFERAHFEDEAG